MHATNQVHTFYRPCDVVRRPNACRIATGVDVPDMQQQTAGKGPAPSQQRTQSPSNFSNGFSTGGTSGDTPRAHGAFAAREAALGPRQDDIVVEPESSGQAEGTQQQGTRGQQ